MKKTTLKLFRKILVALVACLIVLCGFFYWHSNANAKLLRERREVWQRRLSSLKGKSSATILNRYESDLYGKSWLHQDGQLIGQDRVKVHDLWMYGSTTIIVDIDSKNRITNYEVREVASSL
jgi:hypothetical protein